MISGPARVVELDLANALPDLGEGRPAALLVVVRLCGVPLGTVALPAATDAGALAARLRTELAEPLRRAQREHGVLPQLSAAGLEHARCAVRGRREATRSRSAGFSLVLCTRDRPVELERCLRSLLELDHKRFELLVVDNAPRDTLTREICARYARVLPLRYLVEPVPGLSRARNTGVAAARHDLLAFLDDDERVDPLWLLGLAAEFEDPSVGVVSGPVLPAELETPAQAHFELLGGHTGGRGFERVVFDARYRSDVQSPMYPSPPFGVGANMAFRRRALRQAGGFDTALGAGTPAGGAEDTAAFTEAMLAGWTMVYTPAALTWHYHRRDDAALHAQLRGYRTGLGAYYLALLRRDPRRLVALVRLVPRGLASGRLRPLVSGGLGRLDLIGNASPGLKNGSPRTDGWKQRLIARLRCRAA